MSNKRKSFKFIYFINYKRNMLKLRPDSRIFLCKNIPGLGVDACCHSNFFVFFRGVRDRIADYGTIFVCKGNKPLAHQADRRIAVLPVSVTREDSFFFVKFQFE